MRRPRIYFARPPRQALLAFGLLVVIWTLALSIRSMGISPTARAAHTVNQWMRPPPRKQNHDLPHLPAGAVVPCVGPRGKNLDGNSQDEAEFIDASVAPFKSPYPEPFIGSYDAMKAPKTYTTVDRRYGPFGHLENEPGYNFTKVDWNTIDWGRLQNQCLSRNSQRFGVGAAPLDFASNAGRRFALQSRTMMPKIKSWDQFNETGRTAIVIRTWGTYNWLPADLQHVRSLITETALWSGGKYAVILLVHLQDKDAGIFTSDEAYDKAFKNTTIPQELRSISLLWDDNLLESWYPKIPEHQTMYQVFQPMQLLALHYPEFDHYWQFEMDQRFTGHAGKYLEASTEFARKEPRKQIWERASFPYLPKAYSSYEDFFKRVDDANHGGTHYWGAVGIPDIQAIGPQPPTQHATQDDFKWGVGEDADCVVASVCANVLTSNSWVFKDWLMNAKEDKRNVPRWFCPPAIQRGSRTLLLEIHRAQHTLGLAVPSEATLPTYALWLGLKISYPPMPVYHQDQGTEAEAALFEKWNHGGASASEDGFGLADPQDYFDWKTTFWWTSNFAKQTIDAFYGAPWNDQPYPHQLVKHEGKVYAPNMMMHPVKQ